MTNTRKQAEFDQQLGSCQQELEKARSVDDPILISKVQEKIAKLYFSVKDYENGLAHFDKAIQQAQRRQDRELEAYYIGSKGTAYLHHKLPEEGFLCFEKSLEIE